MGRTARDVMTADPACCSPQTTLDQVAKMMVLNDCGEIPVIDSANRPIGVITDRDIVCRADRRSPAEGRLQSLAARGASPASHRDGRGARLARRDEEEYREYLTEEQRSQLGCIARRMQRDLHHGLLAGGRERTGSSGPKSGRATLVPGVWPNVRAILAFPGVENAVSDVRTTE